jgi:hypothetical protein
MKKWILVCGMAAAIAGSASGASAAMIAVGVDGRAMPWDWVDGGLNDAYQYGVLDGLGPTVVDAGDGIAVAAGNTIDVAYLAGLTDAFGVPGGTVDALGHDFWEANDTPGSSGEVFPSFYMSPYPIYLNALVGTFADASGAIVGSPFHIGLGGSFVVPVGATQLQLGVNDDIFADNTGSLRVCVSDAGECATVPEPFTAGLLALGLSGIAVRAIRRRS